MKRWDIFCKIVDNYGDIGVCWRLARQLQVEHGLQIRLWIDDLAAAQKIITGLNINKNSQFYEKINILKWYEGADFSQAADVVIEAFACELPAAYLATMAKNKSKWINLEYLSAETWVDDFHAKPSPQGFINSNHGLTRYFYFPGFTEKTGGLIREANILGHHSDESRNPVTLKTLDSNFRRNDDEDALKISLFCYTNAPIKDLFTALQANIHKVDVYVPEGIMLPKVAEFFGKKKLQAGDKLKQNNLTINVLPFLSQSLYDQLLRECDLNFVRGEDSWLRAIWAGKPFIWQPYIQEENTHVVKLNAFLELFYSQYDKKQLPCEAHRYWSAGQLPKHFLDVYLDDLNTIHAHTQLQSKQLAQQTDLATKLVDFCNNC